MTQYQRRQGFTLQNFSAKNLGGFTLIELILVVTFFMVLGSAGVLILRTQLLGSLESDSQLIVERLYAAQAKAQASVSGAVWGIHFDNTVSSSPFYALFPGTSYSVASTTYYLTTQVEFYLPAAGTSTDVVFNKFTGTVSSSQSIIIRLKSDTQTQQAKQVSVNTGGQITVANYP